MSDDLVTWLRAQLDEDELLAQAAIEEERFFPSPEFTIAYQWERRTRHTNGAFGSGFVPGAPSPARVLAEVEAKRAIVAEHAAADPKTWRTGDAAVDCTFTTWPCFTLRHLAAIYADRPGYQEAWRP